MILERYPELRPLSSADELELVSELWDDLAAHAEGVPVAPELIAELDRRLEAYHQDPSRFSNREAVKARLLGNARSNADF